jgi:GTP-binding protein EngB required for normal cell division
MTALATVAPATDGLDALVTEAREFAARLDRDDLAERLAEIRRRTSRTDTVVCVVGEFKKGKSALINALLGSAVCPVDDDLATTAVTLVRYGDTSSAVVQRRVDGESVLESIDPDAVPEWTLERGDRDRRRDVDLVEVRLPNPMLQGGLTLVDTPGVGGLNAGHAAATLAFLPSADALVFVTDASAELSGPELEFLASARGAGPPVLVAVTKIDMYPEWRRIVDIDVGHLAAIGLVERPFPLSAVLRTRSDERDDESGYGAFTDALLGDVMERARTATLATALADVRWVLGQLREPLAAERAALADPSAAVGIASELAAVRDRLATLEHADAAWSTRLDDEFTALRGTIAFDFQREMRGILREIQAEIEATDPGGTWPELNVRIQDEIATAVRGAFRRATTGAAEVQSTIAGMLADEETGGGEIAPSMAFDIEEFWTGAPEFEGRTRSRLGAGYGVVTGAKAGVDLLGLVGTLLGAAIVGPAVLGVAAIYGGKEVIDERRRRLTDRRQQARTFVSDLVEEIRFQVEGRLTRVLDEMQRQMRARFMERIAELRRTMGASAAALERAAAQEAASRQTRQAEVEATIADLDALHARVRALRPAG